MTVKRWYKHWFQQHDNERIYILNAHDKKYTGTYLSKPFCFLDCVTTPTLIGCNALVHEKETCHWTSVKPRQFTRRFISKMLIYKAISITVSFSLRPFAWEGSSGVLLLPVDYRYKLLVCSAISFLILILVCIKALTNCRKLNVSLDISVW